MKRISIKSAVFGFIVGALVTTSVTAFGLVYASGQVEAWLQDKQVRIAVDGSTVALPSDMHIIAYDNRVYTPARLVAEALGATVEWDEKMQTIRITPPEPEIIEVEKIVEKESGQSSSSSGAKYYYSPLPIRAVKENVHINITKVEFYNSRTELYMDFENNNDNPVMFIKEQSYIECDGVKYTILEDYAGRFDNTTTSFYKEKDMRLIFDAVPKDAKEIKLNLVMELYRRDYHTNEYPVIHFEFYIDPRDQSFFDYN